MMFSDVKAGIIGVGSIGKGLAYQAHVTQGIRPAFLVDIHIDKAIAVAEWLEIEYEIVERTAQAQSCIKRGKCAIAEDGMIAASCESIDVLIESSNAVYKGALYAMEAIQHGTHVVLMNYEAALMHGPWLNRIAKDNNVSITCADGDQPSVLARMIEEVQFWGFDIVMAGNIKGYMDRYTDPTKIIPEADKRSLDYQMCSSYTDGTKLNIEMSVLANSLNYRTAKPGMIGPGMNTVYNVFNHYDFKSLHNKGGPYVDYILGANPKGGVFVVAYNENPFQQYTLNWYPPDLGPGPYYLFYRHYHLGHIEAMKCVFEAVHGRKVLLSPGEQIYTNVNTYAKQDLKPGDILDGMGGYLSYGLIENRNQDGFDQGVPILLSDGMKIKREIPKDQRITVKDIEMALDDLHYQLYEKSLAIIS